MDKNDKRLLDIFEDDTYGLLDIKAQSSHTNSEEERLVSSYQEILNFYENNHREPEEGNSVAETSLYYRLKGVREDKSKIDILGKYDKYNLINNPKEKEIKSISDIFNDDSLGILNDESQDIFTLQHVPKVTTMPDYVGSRKVCKDFENYQQLFKLCQSDLSSGKRKLYPFRKEQQIQKGYFFVLKGVLLFIADVGKKEKKKGKTNARLRCIFENGTESDMLLRSLSAELYKNGRRVTEHEDKLLDAFNNISQDDKENGFIYILKSKSDKSEIKAITNLYKIGFSIMTVEERIRNAEQEPTYLMAPVTIVSVYKCYNMNPQKFEQLIHNFFGNSCLNIDVFDKNGFRHTPREWFIAPLPIIEQAIHFILNGEIINYKYDPDKYMIVGR